jgi:4-hydroxy 2-oxovalerate aldolase
MLLPKEKGDTQYVAMTRFGYLDLNSLKPYDGKSINGIRVTFHEDEVKEAVDYCKKIQEKGYRVYVQPVGTTSYSDKYLLQLIELVNEIKPYAFYIVDTLGLMRSNDVLRMFYLLDNNLGEEIVVGFHSHNNLQLSFSNSQILAEVRTKRTIILDASVHGMGRGAGNLNTELIAQHLNIAKGSQYITDYILEIMDETINSLYEKYTWGYSIPYYLAAINNCHPNYATYLMNRKTLTIKSIRTILNNISKEKRELYDSDYIAQLYLQYQRHYVDDRRQLELLEELFYDKTVLLVAPGPSLISAKDDIQAYQKTVNPMAISINFDGNDIQPDFYFFSNDKRYQKFIEVKDSKKTIKQSIVTSNINVIDNHYNFRVNYNDYLNTQPLVNDNATLMLLSLLIKLNVKKVALAGFDGFQINASRNYYEDELETSLDSVLMKKMNEQITSAMIEICDNIELTFITPSIYKKNVY